MYCPNCGKKIPADSNFCEYCGHKTLRQPTGDEKADTSAGPQSLWDKFAMIWDSKGDERKSYESQTSNEVWELIRRMSKVGFESFITEYKEQFNKQPYKVVEALEPAFLFAATGGYWLWMAEALLGARQLKKLKPITTERFFEEWKKTAFEGYEQTSKSMSNELGEVMNNFHSWRVKNLLETAPMLEEMPTEIIEDLKGRLGVQVYWGYAAGLTESNYRK
jgi:hypothetical protein